MVRVERVAFPNGNRARVALVDADGTSGDEVVSSLGLERSPVVVLNGSTEELAPELQSVLFDLFRGGLVPAAIEEGAALLTGGTDAGIFALIGGALDESRDVLPSIGVAPREAVTWPGRVPTWVRRLVDSRRAPLEPHHSHFVLVAGKEWGVETPVLLSVARSLGADRPSIAVLAGGGGITRQEVLGHGRDGREVVVLAGSGRLADELAASPEVADRRLTVFDVTRGGAALGNLLRERLGSTGAN